MSTTPTHLTFIPNPDSKSEKLIARQIRCRRLNNTEEYQIRLYQANTFAYYRARHEGRHEDASVYYKRMMNLRHELRFSFYLSDFTVFQEDARLQAKENN